MNMEDLRLFLEEQTEIYGDLNWKVLMDVDGNYACTIYSPESSILQYLNNNGFPVVYSDFSGLILVKFQHDKNIILQEF